jgi:hypothetical protein
MIKKKVPAGACASDGNLFFCQIEMMIVSMRRFLSVSRHSFW